MLVINFKGKKPAQSNYDYSVIGNSHSDIVRFALQEKLGEFTTEELYSEFDGYVKLQSAGDEYLDKVFIDDYNITGDCLTLDLHLSKKMTHFKNLSLQVQFESDEGNIVAQSEIVELTLHNTINADEPISDEYPEAIQQLEAKVIGYDKKIDKNTQDIAEIKAKGDCIEIGNPSDFLDERGLQKIIRPMDDNGNVNKSYMVNKTIVPSTLVVCEQQNDNADEFDYTNDLQSFEEDIGQVNFRKIFGQFTPQQSYIDEIFGFVQRNTKAFIVGEDGSYGSLDLSNCIPNKTIRFIVGKYFEYNEHGEKIFDEHCAMYSDCFAGNVGTDETREITQERQVFELATNEYGGFYFNSDGNVLGFGNTRFILYGIEIGEPAHTEFKAEKLVSDKDLDTYVRKFKVSDNPKAIYDYWLSVGGDFDVNCKMMLVIQGDENTGYPNFMLNIHFGEQNTTFNIFNETSIREGNFDTDIFRLGTNPDYETIGDIISDCTDYSSVKSRTIRDIQPLTQQEYENLPYKSNYVLYCIKEE